MECDNNLIINSRENKQLLESETSCDKYDFLIAAGAGMIGGLIDVFLVGAPGDSKLGKWTDAQVDNAVKSFAKLSGWDDKNGKVSSAIGFLERKFRVNYDQRHSSDVGDLFDMSTKNHHMKSLGHAPDIVGLFFSILNQFTSTASFVSGGQLITIDTKTFELQGGNFISKIFCGITNWVGHIMSDIAGSSGARGGTGRGSGVVMPFYEFFSFCKFGKFNVGKDKQDLATIATRAFQEGYDFRHGLTMAIPVVITELLIRLLWALRRFFQYKKPLKECLPTKKHADLRLMLLVGDGTLCVIDGIDAGVRSGGNFLAFFMRLNLVAWFRFIMLIFREIGIRLGITFGYQSTIDAYKKINIALTNYLNELEKIDKERFQKEVEMYDDLGNMLSQTKNDVELSQVLLKFMDSVNMEKPWEGDFDEHMSNKDGTLIFK